MLTLFWSFIGFVITMGIIVTIHEWGHYQVAKWFNFKIERFSVGFGKPIWSRQGAETEFVIGAIPLGGYVKFADEREAPVAEQDLPRAFNRQSVYKRMAVVLAGPVINLILAWLVFTLMFMIGVSGLKPIVNEFNASSPIVQSFNAEDLKQLNSADYWQVSQVNAMPVESWKGVHQQILQSLANDESNISFSLTNAQGNTLVASDVPLSVLDINQPKQNWLALLGLQPAQPKIPAVVGEVVEAGPAQIAGLQRFDKIVQIDDIKINSWQDFVKVVQANPGAQIEVVYQRDNAQFSTQVTLLAVMQESQPQSQQASQQVDKQSKPLGAQKAVGKMGVGVYVDEEVLQPFYSQQQYGFITSSKLAYERSVELIDMSLVMLKRMLLGEVSAQNLSGPISIAQFSGQALQSGLIAFLSLLGILSLSIGILNLLPIPMLDGGHLLFYVVEAIKGSPVSENTQQLGHVFGLVIIVGLTILAISNDILRIFHG